MTEGGNRSARFPPSVFSSNFFKKAPQYRVLNVLTRSHYIESRLVLVQTATKTIISDKDVVPHGIRVLAQDIITITHTAGKKASL